MSVSHAPHLASAACALGIFTLWGFYIVYRADDLAALAQQLGW